ncbi:Uncharacterised protein [Vibrio cholerae]|nr:Uncharacterised protein [Vibrio cholerae]
MSRFNIGVENGLFEITAANKRARIDVNRGHGFGLIDDQIPPRFELHFAFERALNLIFRIVHVKNGLIAVVQL